MTNDIDVVADLREADIDLLIDDLGAGCYMSRDAAMEAVRTDGTFNVIHVSTAIKADSFVAGSDAFDQERLRRRINMARRCGDL